MVQIKSKIIKPADFIKNYSPLRKTDLLYSIKTNKKKFIFIEKTKKIIRKIYLWFLANPNDSEAEKIFSLIEGKRGKKKLTAVTQYLSDKFSSDHLRKFEYSFLVEALDNLGMHNKTLVDMGGGFSYSTVVPMFFSESNSRIFSLDYIDGSRHSKFPVEYIKGDCMKTGLPSDSADIVTLISTLEHVGLGRYGDPLNPKGDIETMKEAGRILKKGGYLIMTVPYGYPSVVYNLHRVYDRGRISLLIKGFKIVKKRFSLLGRPAEEYEVAEKKPLLEIEGYYGKDKRIYNPQGGAMFVLKKN